MSSSGKEYQERPIVFIVNSYTPNNEFVPDDVLTRNMASHLCQLPEKQQKIYNALALASVSSASGLMDTSRNIFLTSAALKQFIGTQQMEYVAEHYAAKLIQEHEPDPVYRAKQLMSFEGFVRFLSDPTNTLTTISFRLVVDIKKSSFLQSDLPVILSTENRYPDCDFRTRDPNAFGAHYDDHQCAEYESYLEGGRSL